MTDFATVRLAGQPMVVAPDGIDVRPLAVLGGGSFAHFALAPGGVSRAVVHRTVEEIWYCLGGSGAIWRSQDGCEAVDALMPGVAVTIPLGTRFQVRSDGAAPLAIVAVTMPPWPGDQEAEVVAGKWPPTVGGTG